MLSIGKYVICIRGAIISISRIASPRLQMPQHQARACSIVIHQSCQHCLQFRPPWVVVTMALLRRCVAARCSAVLQIQRQTAHRVAETGHHFMQVSEDFLFNTFTFACRIYRVQGVSSAEPQRSSAANDTSMLAARELTFLCQCMLCPCACMRAGAACSATASIMPVTYQPKCVRAWR